MIDFVKKILGIGKLENQINRDFIMYIPIKSGDRMIVGYLSLNKKNKWVFKYTEEFKKQDYYTDIFHFRSGYKEQYITDNLISWPVFYVRMASPANRNDEDKYLDMKKPEHQCILLSKYGKSSINNPYILEVI